MSRFDDFFGLETDEDKAYMTFTFKNNGCSTRISNEYPYDCTWKEVLDDVVKALEGEFGYSFSLEDFGIYYDGKDKDE